MSKKKLVKVKDNHDLARVEDSAVVVNLDQEGFHTFIEHRNKVLAEKEKMNQLENQVQELKSMIESILKDKNEQT